MTKPSPNQNRCAKRALHRGDLAGPEDADALSQRVRAVLIRRMDAMLAKRIMPVAMGERFGLDPDQWSDMVRLIQESLFPEDFADRPPVSYRDAGIIPGKGRLERVALSDYEKFAKVFAN